MKAGRKRGAPAWGRGPAGLHREEEEGSSRFSLWLHLCSHPCLAEVRLSDHDGILRYISFAESLRNIINNVITKLHLMVQETGRQGLPGPPTAAG